MTRASRRRDHPTPGEVSLAHHGVLFLDELPEFRRNVLEVLRQPLEEMAQSPSRAPSGSITYPANFMLVAAHEPVPVRLLRRSEEGVPCSPLQIQRYRAQDSGPLLDRIDIHVEVPRALQGVGGQSAGEPPP